MSEQIVPESVAAADADMDDQAEVALVELAPGVAAVIAASVPEGLEVIPFGLGENQDQRLADALSLAVSGANAGATAASTLVSVQGLVRIAPETIQQTKTMTTMVKDGWNLGTLMNGSEFGASVRWLPAADAQAALAAASLGPQLALLAISAQLASISRRVDENIELTRDVLEVLHADHCHAIKAMYDAIDEVLEVARGAGAVTEGNFDRIKHLGPGLRKERSFFEAEVAKHLTALNSDYAERRKYLAERQGWIVGDLQGLLMAENASHRYHMLQAASLATSLERTKAEDETIRLIAERGIQEHEVVMERIASLLAQLDSQVHLAGVLTGRSLSPRDVLSRRRTNPGKSVTAMIEYIAALRAQTYRAPEELVPVLTVGGTRPDKVALEVLRWVLPYDEALLVLLDVELSGIRPRPGYLAVTRSSLVLADKRDLRSDGVLETWVLLEDVRYVRYREGKKTGSLDVITKDLDLHVTIPGATSDEETRACVSEIVDLLTAAANTPADEQRTSTLLEAPPTRHELLAEVEGRLTSRQPEENP